MQAIVSGIINVIYEAAFQYNDVLIFLDILVRSDDGWIACEVKSSRTLSTVYYADAALQYYVLKGSGLRVNDFLLYYINPEYKLRDQLNPAELFQSESVIKLAENRLDETHHQIEAAKSTLSLKQSPDIAIGIHCNTPYPCDFKGHCWKNVPKLSILQLTAFDEEELFEWYHKGISDPREVTNVSINEIQRKQIDALSSKSGYYDLKLAKGSLPGQNETIAFVDILFTRPAIPVISGAKPYEYLPLASALLFDDQQYDAVIFRPNVEDVISFILWLEQLTQRFDKVIIYNPMELKTFLKSDFFTSIQLNHSLKDISMEKIWAVYDFLLEIQFYFPGLNLQSGQAEVSRHCTDLPPLSDRYQLIGELISHENPKNLSGNRQKILDYLLSLKALFNYISQLK